MSTCPSPVPLPYLQRTVSTPVCRVHSMCCIIGQEMQHASTNLPSLCSAGMAAVSSGPFLAQSPSTGVYRDLCVHSLSLTAKGWRVALS